MGTPDQRARDQDRDAAIEVVEAAWADGQIVEADRDKRVEELLRAHTLAEVEMLVHDLQPPADASVVGGPPPAVRYGPAGVPGSVPASATPKAVLLLVVILVAGIATAVVVGIAALVSSISSQVASTEAVEMTRLPDVGPAGGEPDVQSRQGYADLLDAVQQTTGSTTVFSAVLYPTYAVLDLPVDATSGRLETWYFDGELSRAGVKRTSTDARIDLRSVDPEVIVTALRKVRRLVDEPTSSYAIVRAPDDDRAVIFAYASNDYAETEYLGLRRDGTLTYDSTR